MHIPDQKYKNELFSGSSETPQTVSATDVESCDLLFICFKEVSSWKCCLSPRCTVERLAAMFYSSSVVAACCPVTPRIDRLHLQTISIVSFTETKVGADCRGTGTFLNFPCTSSPPCASATAAGSGSGLGSVDQNQDQRISCRPTCEHGNAQFLLSELQA